MIKTAITGVMGSGKSTLSRILREMGYPVFDCDEASRQLMQPGQPGWQRCMQTFGEQICDDQGQLDRSRLARLVFDDPAARRQLEELTHPLIIEKMMEDARRCQGDWWFAEVPLLFEAGLQSLFDEIITVSAPQPLILQRLQQGRHISRQEALRRMAAQMSPQQKEAGATLVIVNDGDLEAMRATIRQWIREKYDAAESKRHLPV